MNNLACAMTSDTGRSLVLRDVTLHAKLTELLCEVAVSQTSYRNDESVPIEAVYTFPLPLDAVLLELDLELGGRRLRGVVVEKQRAEQQYEDALTAGHSAVLLEEVEPGLYTASVGNLPPGEAAVMRFSYAFTLRWHGDTLRLMLPTVIAPRYSTSPLAPHQQPVVSLAVENHFTLELDVRGALARAQFCSPSHDLTVVPHVDGIRLALDRQAVVMDRDFVLNVKLPQTPRAFAQQDSDVGGQLVMASFVPFFPGLRAPRPLELAVVVDCSGSMAGDSITQAKRALESMLDALGSDDRLTLIAFGNTTHALCDQPHACDAHHLAAARRFVAGLDANLGGTQIAAALHTAYQALRNTRAGDMFLVTDGEVADWAPVVDEARVTGHRLFTVGVGSAVAESFVRRPARDTGGACELVAPREGMAEKVLRHFERMRAPRCTGRRARSMSFPRRSVRCSRATPCSPMRACPPAPGLAR